MKDKRAPRDWGEDPLTKYLDACRSNQFATFSNMRPQIDDLLATDDMFRRLLHGAVDPKPILPMEFLLRSHAAYLTAVSAAMAGQLYELHPLLRTCLENASYGHFIGNNQDRWNRWNTRDKLTTRSQKDKWRKEFAIGKIIRKLKETDAALGDFFSNLYDRAIQFGGHPNQMGYSMNSETSDLSNGDKLLSTVYLQDDRRKLNFCMEFTTQVGLCGLRIAREIYPARMQAGGIGFELDDMCKKYEFTTL